MIASRLARTAALGMVLASIGLPAMAQPYGYGPPPPPPPGYGPPPPPADYPPPQPDYGPPGSRCEASYPGRHHWHRFVCPMRVSKPVGAPCRCVAPPPPGYPPEPPARGRVIP
jgi:hypothetical protein